MIQECHTAKCHVLKADVFYLFETRATEREEASDIDIPNDCNGQGQPGTWNSIQAPLWVAGAQAPELSSAVLIGALAGRGAQQLGQPHTVRA